MKLSIIIPVYNVEKYLNECLDSVFSQNLDDCEIIVINDGSTDKSMEILSDYQLKHAELIVFSQENLGLSSARNLGLKHSTGKYIYFLDSDDYLLSKAVTIIKKYIEKENTEVISFNALYNSNSYYVESTKIGEKVQSGINFFIDYYKKNGNYPRNNVWLYIYRRTFLEYYNLNFLEGVYYEDIAFTVQVFYYATSISTSNIPILYYRQFREDSISTKVSTKIVLDKAIICRVLNDFFQNNNFYNIYFYNSLFKKYILLLSEANTYGFTKQKFRYFNKDDKKIMKNGITTEYEFKLWALSIINIELAMLYYNNKLTSILRRFINITLSILNKLFFSYPLDNKYR